MGKVVPDTVAADAASSFSVEEWRRRLAVEVNNMVVHAVTNAGHAPRIHLIFEYYDLDQPAPAWVDALARGAA